MGQDSALPVVYVHFQLQNLLARTGEHPAVAGLTKISGLSRQRANTNLEDIVRRASHDGRGADVDK